MSLGLVTSSLTGVDLGFGDILVLNPLRAFTAAEGGCAP